MPDPLAASIFGVPSDDSIRNAPLSCAKVRDVLLLNQIEAI